MLNTSARRNRCAALCMTVMQNATYTQQPVACAASCTLSGAPQRLRPIPFRAVFFLGAVRLLELDLPDHPRGGTRSDHARGEVAGDDRIGADDRPLADGHAAGHDAVRAEPAAVADRHWALGAHPLVGDRQVGVVEAVVGVRQEAVVREHAVTPDVDPLGRGHHATEVQDRAFADPRRRRLGVEREPATRFDQHPGLDLGPALVKRLEQVADDREADVELAAKHVPAQAQLADHALVAIVVPALPPEEAGPLPQRALAPRFEPFAIAARARNSYAIEAASSAVVCARESYGGATSTTSKPQNRVPARARISASASCGKSPATSGVPVAGANAGSITSTSKLKKSGASPDRSRTRLA